MENNRKILIITDTSDQMQSLAARITAVIMNPPFERYSIITTEVEQFSTTELLPAQVFFLGCQNKESFSNEYLEDLFTHINLAGRSCGIFSPDARAIIHLEKLVADSDVTVGKPLFIKNDTVEDADLQNWVQGIMHHTYLKGVLLSSYGN